MASAFGYLHTSAKKGGFATTGYFDVGKPALPAGNKENLFKDEIAEMERKERAFCQLFGSSNPEKLINKIYNFFHSKDRSKDLKVLQRFSSIELRKYLELFRKANSSQLLDQKVTLHFTSIKPIKLDKLIPASEKIVIYGDSIKLEETLQPGEHEITMNWNTFFIKALVNRLDGKHFVKKSDNLSNLMGALDNSKLINIEVDGPNQSVQDYVLNNRTSIFQYTPSEIEKMKKDNPTFYQQLQRQVLNFFDNVICEGASEELKAAIRMVWNRKDIVMFMGGAKGDQWMNGTVGGFGELQGAILFQYYANSLGDPQIARTIANIIGNSLGSYGEKARTDLTIFEKFGIQIKNFSSDKGFNQSTGKSYTRTVEVNLHPSQLPSIGGAEFVSYLANSYFNSSVVPYSDAEINTFIEGHVSELLNLDLSSEFNDKATFYLVGQHLIPGSEILKSHNSRDIRVHTSISHPEPEGDDEYFNSYGESKKGKRGAPPFTEYWRSNSAPAVAGDFTPIKADIGDVDSKISFHTVFTYSAFFNATFKNRETGFSRYRLI